MTNFSPSVTDRLADFLDSKRNVLLVLLVLIIVGVGVFAAVTVIGGKSSSKALAVLDTISYNLTNESEKCTDSELSTRREVAFKALTPYLNKKGVAGVRANMLAAEIAYSNKDYESAANYWVTAASRDKKSYTNGLCLFNAGSAFEEIDKLDSALDCYTKASNNKDNLLASHAKFSAARVMESKGDTAGALEAYKDINDKSPDTQWGQLAKTRVIALE